jgi:elongator complex protein 5
MGRQSCREGTCFFLSVIIILTALLQAISDPTQNLTFNLNLTPLQQQSRAVVPLPYAHQGMHVNSTLSRLLLTDFFFSGTENPTQNPFVINYDPDSADDIDDDDPDEDLDI